jgi:hypothetical protein
LVFEGVAEKNERHEHAQTDNRHMHEPMLLAVETSRERMDPCVQLQGWYGLSQGLQIGSPAYSHLILGVVPTAKLANHCPKPEALASSVGGRLWVSVRFLGGFQRTKPPQKAGTRVGWYKRHHSLRNLSGNSGNGLTVPRWALHHPIISLV